LEKPVEYRPVEESEGGIGNWQKEPDIKHGHLGFRKGYLQQKHGDVENHTEKGTKKQHIIHNKSLSDSVEQKDSGDTAQTVNFDTATRSLHKLVRHWLGLRQDCEDLQAQLKFLHDTYIKIKEKRGQNWIIDKTVDASEALQALASQCDICVRWTQVYHDRTQTRINLVSTLRVVIMKSI
jgi:hypothetical protein